MHPSLQVAIDGWAENGRGLVALAEVLWTKLTVVSAPAASAEAMRGYRPYPGLAFLQTCVAGNGATSLLPARRRGIRCNSRYGRELVCMMRSSMRLRNALAILALCFLGTGPAAAQMGLADARRGQELSARLCSGCHSVSPDQAATVNADVPTFRAIADRPETTAERLAGRIIVPHPPMPNVQLTVAEMRDIIAYILSLRAQR
jgi:cytochrome c